MSLFVTHLQISLPSKEERQRIMAYTSRKPMATVYVVLENGASRQIVVPLRAAALLKSESLGFPLPEDDAFDAIHEIEYRACLQAITDMLSRREYASGELRDKLSRYGYRDQEIERALTTSRERRYLDDNRFTSFFIEERIRRGWGRRRIESELYKKGIRTDEIEGYPERYFSDDEDLSRALDVLRRKPCSDTHPRDKFIRFLVSRGYSYSIAQQAARARIEELEEGSESFR